MIIYAHVTNHFRSFGEIWSFDKSCSIIGSYWEIKRKRSANFSESIYLACRRGFGESFFENRKKAWTEREEKKWLKTNRATIIMLLLMKGAVL